MDIVKKNLLSIICGVIALVCVILLFFPLGGMYEDLTQAVSDSAAVRTRLESERNAQRTWPTLSSKPEDAIPLTRMPTPATLTAGRRLTETWTEQASTFLTAAIELQRSQLQPLVPGALPNGGQTPRTQFQDAYAKKFTVAVDPTTGRPYEDVTIFRTILNGGMPPTAEEIKEAQDRTAEKVAADTARVVGETVQNPEEVQQRVQEAVAAVPERRRLDAALTYSIYVDPLTAVQPNADIAGNVAPTPNAMFDAQVKLWVMEEVFEGIAQTNADAAAARQGSGTNEKGVFVSPVKRLLSLVVTPPYKPVPATPETAATPPTVPADAQVKIEKDYSVNPFGHKSNTFYDVIPFKLQFVCEADTLATTLAGLSKGRYLTVQLVQVRAVDSATHAVQGFLYGSQPVVQVTIDGHYMLLRRFVGDFMPPDIIRGLTAEAAPAAETMY